VRGGGQRVTSSRTGFNVGYFFINVNTARRRAAVNAFEFKTRRIART
jgi:hypothetical protein